MKTQINIPNSNVATFIEACDSMQIIYHQIEERQFDTRYEVTAEGASLFHLGSWYGLEVANKNNQRIYGSR
jgi:hypothetical protein